MESSRKTYRLERLAALCCSSMIKSLRTFTVFLSLPVALCAQQATTPATNAATTAAPAAAIPIANPKTPEEFFARARQLSDLEAAGIPFHLKATYVASGDAEFTGNGTFEEWFQSKDVWRKEATLGNYRLVSVDSPQGPSLYASSLNIPVPLVDAMAKVLLKVAPDMSVTNNWHIKQKKVDGVKLTVVFVKPQRQPDGSMMQGSADYFTATGILRIQQDAGVTVTTYNKFQPFRALLIPHQIGSTSGKNSVAISIETLQPLSSDKEETSALLNSPTDLPLAGKNLIAAPGDGSGSILYEPPPRYPFSAKQERIQGTVVLGVTIDESGNVRDLRVIKSPGQSLDNAALDAVRQWRYKPTILNGKPVAIDTTISIVFALNR